MGKKNTKREVFIQIRNLYELQYLCDEFLFIKDPQIRDIDGCFHFLNEISKNTHHAVYDNYVMCKIKTKISKEEIQKFCREFKLNNNNILSYVESHIRYL